MALPASSKEVVGRFKRPQQATLQAGFIPAPQRGLDAISGAASGDPMAALRLINMIPQEFGLHVRHGYQEWCPPVPLGDGIKTIIPFNSDSTDTTTNKLFVATSDGIYDCTVQGAAPVKVVNFAIKTARAGWCSWHHYNITSDQYLLVCDLDNGYYTYAQNTNTWTKVPSGGGGSVTGVDPANVDFVTVWKNRVWFIEKDSTQAWYLPVGQITGLAVAFNFGNKFKYGGFLKALYNWTLDGGAGVDDYLVGVSEAGDVIVYQGTDPSNTGGNTFSMRGSWWIGKVARGRRLGSDIGGDLLVLSTFGLMQMSKLISGLPATDEQASISHLINPRLNNYMNDTLEEFGWEIKTHPRAQILIVLTPKRPEIEHVQFVYNFATRGWCTFSGVPMLSGDAWRGRFYFGTRDNQLFEYTGYADNVLLADDGATAQSVQWEMQTTFNNMQQPGVFKRVQLLRPQFIAEIQPTYLVEARYDFDLSAIYQSPSPGFTNIGLWDIGQWDVSLWGGGYTVDQPSRGAVGTGRHVAVVLRGESSGPTVYIGTDIAYNSGGLL
jgi:hypothetical protein